MSLWYVKINFLYSVIFLICVFYVLLIYLVFFFFFSFSCGKCDVFYLRLKVVFKGSVWYDSVLLGIYIL